MKCIECMGGMDLPASVQKKVEVFAGKDPGVEDLRQFHPLYCNACGFCHICREATGEEIRRCAMCWFHYHPGHEKSGELAERVKRGKRSEDFREEDRCSKCLEIGEGATHSALVGPEISLMERRVRESSWDVVKKVKEVMKRSRAIEKSSAGIQSVYLGSVHLKPLYTSPYPEEYVKNASLYICDKCLAYFSSKMVIKRHQLKCRARMPPGELLYADKDGLAIFEVSGAKRASYCQSLCLLAKMFLNHKTLYYDVESFLFYVVGSVSASYEFTMHGYFSKEGPEAANNLSCIVVFPPYQKMGLGSFLIDFSYFMSRKGAAPPYTAGPEQPLSEQGERAYMAYWADTVARYVLKSRIFHGTEEDFQSASAWSGIHVQSLKDAYAGMARAFGKPPMFPDLLLHRDKVKKTRRIHASGVIKQ